MKRSPIRKMSEKKLSSLKGPIYSTIRSPKKRMKAKKRKPSETLRIYGPPARRAFVKSLPCVGCGSTQYIENAHIETGGTGRKADYDKIVPLCGNRFWSTEKTSNFAYGCHQLLHGMGRESFEKYRGANLEMLAAHTEQAWLEYQSTQSNPRLR